MELIKNELKQTVEDCKRRARDHGLSFRDETLEFIVTNEDMIKLSPKGMIPTLYDYWVHDIYVLQDKGKYEFYPHNPYETVINTRPPLSFYNDNNPDWLNVMIFYHVIGHIDFFQNNVFFAKTWLDDFLSKAAADAQVITDLRQEHGRWVDYVIEFARGADNLVDYYDHLADPESGLSGGITSSALGVPTAQAKIDFFFDEYLQSINKVSTFKFIEELEYLNQLRRNEGEENARNLFLVYIEKKYLDFGHKYDKRPKKAQTKRQDVMQYIMENSPKLRKDENDWMRRVMQIVRDTSLYFQPQIRTKILNEGWASYWHEVLFMEDPAMRTHEFEWSRINAGVVSLPRVGLNPYAVGLRLFKYLEAKADRGMLSYEFEKVTKVDDRKIFDRKTGAGRDFIFKLRQYGSDANAIREFVDQDFCNEFKLFVVGKRINPERQVWEYYVKSRKAEDFRRQIEDNMYHPPHITVHRENTEKNGGLHLVHHFEGRELVREYIHNTMLGIEFLWGDKVFLETHEVDESQLEQAYQEGPQKSTAPQAAEPEFRFQKVVYTMENRKLTRQVFDQYLTAR